MDVGTRSKKQTWSMLLFNENIHFSWVKQEIFIISRQLSFYFWKTQFWLLEISDNSVQFLKNSVLKRQKLSFSEISMAWMSALVSKKQACITWSVPCGPFLVIFTRCHLSVSTKPGPEVMLAIPEPRSYRNCKWPPTRLSETKSPFPLDVCPLYNSIPSATMTSWL